MLLAWPLKLGIRTPTLLAWPLELGIRTLCFVGLVIRTPALWRGPLGWGDGLPRFGVAP